MQVFIARDGQQQGPFSFETIRARASSASLAPTDLAWYEGCTDWIPLSRIPGLFTSPPPPPPVVATPAPSAAPNQSSVAMMQVRPWVRCWARLIDLFLFSICCGIVISIAGPGLLKGANDTVLSLAFLFLWCFVEPIFLSTWGATPGKALLRIDLRSADGARLNYGSALARSFDVWLRGFGMGIPVASFVTFIVAHNTLTKNGVTSWDRDRGFRVTHLEIGPARVIVAIALFIGFAVLMGWVSK